MKLARQALMTSQMDPAINVLIPTLRETVRKLVVTYLAVPMANARRWYATSLRLAADPKEDAAVTRLNMRFDIRVTLPTAAIHCTGGQWAVHMDRSKYLASRIPHAKLIELPESNPIFLQSRQRRHVAKIEGFFARNRSERVLLTVLMTDIVGSTDKATELGDEKWRQLLQQHDRIIRRNIISFEGNEVNTTGDRFNISFTGPTQAIYCAKSIHRDLEALGLRIRAGVHTGECERCGNGLSGVALHLAARIMGMGKSGETIVSSTVKDLVVGSGTTFSNFGNHKLKGIQNEWQLFRVED